MPLQLLQLAESVGVSVEYWDFQTPLEAIYWSEPGATPMIGLSKKLKKERRSHFRTVLAEELGHHFTSARSTLIKCYNYGNQIIVCREEYRALKWAAEYLLPTEDFCKEAMKRRVAWSLAEYFNVDERLILFKFNFICRINRRGFCDE